MRLLGAPAPALPQRLKRLPEPQHNCRPSGAVVAFKTLRQEGGRWRVEQGVPLDPGRQAAAGGLELDGWEVVIDEPSIQVRQGWKEDIGVAACTERDSTHHSPLAAAAGAACTGAACGLVGAAGGVHFNCSISFSLAPSHPAGPDRLSPVAPIPGGAAQQRARRRRLHAQPPGGGPAAGAPTHLCRRGGHGGRERTRRGPA